MSAVRGLVQISLVVACAATSFVTAQAYMVAKEEIALEKAAGAPTGQKLSDNGDPTTLLTPAMPTKKHGLSAALKTLARKGASSHAKVFAVAKPAHKTASVPIKKFPMRVASNQSEQPVRYGYAPESHPPSAANIFRVYR